MKIYASHGVTDFIICCGFKGYVIKEYFANYFLHMSDVTFDLTANSMIVHERKAEPWKVTLVDTGEGTQTGGRLRRIAPYVAGEDAFCMTYGDGLADVDITALIAHHQRQGLQATLTAVQPPGRYGALHLDGDVVTDFEEKPDGDNAWINGGFFVLEPAVIDLVDGDDCVWEQAPLKTLATQGQLNSFKHRGFWQPMDTLRDRQRLEDLWQQGRAPWKIWS
jgi:glucose-1-phosphate cytidylyltransferase